MTEYNGAASIFIKTLLNKKYSLPAPVIASLVRHYASFIDDDRSLPVLWHQPEENCLIEVVFVRSRCFLVFHDVRTVVVIFCFVALVVATTDVDDGWFLFILCSFFSLSLELCPSD